jgi:chromosome segregation ATPase
LTSQNQAILDDKERIVAQLQSEKLQEVGELKAAAEEVEYRLSDVTSRHEVALADQITKKGFIEELTKTVGEYEVKAVSQEDAYTRVVIERDELISNICVLQMRADADTVANRDEITSLQSSLTTLRDELSTTVKEKSQIITTMNEKLEQKAIQIIDLESDSTKAEVQAMSEETTNAMSALKTKETIIEQLKITNERLQDQVQQFQMEVSEGSSQHLPFHTVTELERHVTALAETKESDDLLVLEKELYIEELKRSLIKLERNIAMLTSENQEYKSTIKELESKLDYLNSSLSEDMLGLLSSDSPIKGGR